MKTVITMRAYLDLFHEYCAMKNKDYQGENGNMYYTNVLDLIGNTPLISLEETTGLQIFAKAEFF